jgi:hypothetical protein
MSKKEHDFEDEKNQIRDLVKESAKVVARQKQRC